MLKAILIGFLFGFSLMGASRMAAAPDPGQTPIAAASIAGSRHHGAALNQVSAACADASLRPLPPRLKILI